MLGAVTDEYDVALMVTRGYPSLTFTYEAAMALGGKAETYLYYFGDLDAHGEHIEWTVQSQLEEQGADFVFERIAVTPERISAMNLPTRPGKAGESWAVEVDAIEPRVLRDLCRGAIEQHVNRKELDYLRQVEALEADVLRTVSRAFRNFDDEDEHRIGELADIAQTLGPVQMFQHLAGSTA